MNDIVNLIGSQEEISKAFVIRKKLISNLRKNPRGWNVKQAVNYINNVVIDAKLYIEYAHLVEFPDWINVVHCVICNRNSLLA